MAAVCVFFAEARIGRDCFGAQVISVQRLETLMGGSQSGGIIRLASDDLDVARRLGRRGPGQCGVQLSKRRNFGREPSLAAQSGRQGVIVPGGEVVVDPIRIRLESAFDHVSIVVEDKDDRF